MARVLCIQPCMPDVVWPPFALDGIVIPGIGSVIKPSVQVGLKGGCDSCEVTAAFMLQIQPFLISISLPMCLLTCVMDILDLVQGIGPPPDPKLAEKIAKAVEDCAKCVTAWTPAVICGLIRDILDLIISTFKCLKGILTKLLTVSLTAIGLMRDPILEIRETGECLYGLVQVQTRDATLHLDWLGTFIKAIEFLFKFAGIPLLPDSLTFSTSGLGASAPMAPIISMIDLAIEALGYPRQAAAACAGSFGG